MKLTNECQDGCSLKLLSYETTEQNVAKSRELSKGIKSLR